MKAIVVTDISVNFYNDNDELIGYINKDVFVIHKNKDYRYTFKNAIIKTLIAMYDISKNINDVSKYIIIVDNEDRYIIEGKQIGDSNDYKITLEIQNNGYTIFECEVNFMIDAIDKLYAAYKDLHCS